MKKIFIAVVVLSIFICACTSNNNNKKVPIKESLKSSESVSHIFVLNDSVKCEIFQNEESYARIKTSKKIAESDFKKVVDFFNIDKSVIYFHIPDFLNRDEEYGSFSGMVYPVVYDDFDEKILLRNRSEKQINEQNRIKKEGVRDEKFANRAYIVSKDFVKLQLKSPKSANFPYSDYKFSNVVNNTVTIESYVDAKNAYDVKVRQYYSIKMQLTGNDWTDLNHWKVISLVFEQ